jgi:serine/threonine-protein kinase
VLPELDDTLAVPAADPVCTATAPRATASPPVPGEPGLVSGQRLGHFRIERLLGAGGMGEVYLATDLALERPVAIKVLPDGSGRDAARRDRLVREARAQARITHPNVGHIYFIGEEAGRLYFAMEYVAGETLAARVAAGPLTVDDALTIIRSAALGLREAQRNGITHRDIKPSNLMIDAHGMVKVLDFGLAAGAPGALGAGPVAQTSLAGTPLYMAPEQARSEPVDFRADIYALGATLFHLVAGRPPFEADTVEALLSKHSSAQRPVLPRRSGQPRTTIQALDALCGRMMAPAAADRFASYDELIRAIELASVEHMRPAGLWVRVMAALVDLILVSVVTFAVRLPIVLLLDSHDFEADLYIMLAYALYRSVFVARSGRTLGLWLFELEVVGTETGGKPALRQAVIRVLVPAGVVAIATVPDRVLGLYDYKLDTIAQIVVIAIACLPPLALLWASLRSVGKQTIWDKLSHTMVRYRTRRTTAI